MKFRTAFSMWLFGKCLEREMKKYQYYEQPFIEQSEIEFTPVRQSANSQPVKYSQDVETSVDFGDTDLTIGTWFMILGWILGAIIACCINHFLELEGLPSAGWGSYIGFALNCWLWIKFRRNYYGRKKCKFSDAPPICVTFVMFVLVTYGLYKTVCQTL